jgi:hypothetical protein
VPRGAAGRWAWPLAFVACLAAAGLASVQTGLDVNWDLKNYHFYNAYSFLTGRLGWDIAPAQIQTYHSPLLDLPFYFLVQEIPSPRVIAFVMASTTGVAAFFLLRLLFVLFPKGRVEDRALWIALAFAIGVTGSMGRSVIGGTMNEWPPAMLLVMALSVLAAATSHHARPSVPALAVAGLLAGLAVGFKLTYGVFAVGLFVAVGAFGALRERALRMLAMGAFLFAGFLLSYGVWGFVLYREFGNPFFPYFNTIFQSPWWEPVAFFDRNFGPRDAIQAIFFPVILARESKLVSEVGFRDWRLAVLFVLSLAAVVKHAVVRRRAASFPATFEHRPGDRHAWMILATFTLVSYLVWLKLFGIYRYLVPLEMLSGALIVGCALYLIPGKNPRRIAIVILAILILGTTRTASWGRVDFRGAYFDVAVPDVPPGSLVIMAPSEPMAYAIPFFRPDTRFVYPASNFLYYDQGNLLAKKAREIIAQHAGPIFTLDFWGRDEINAGLARWNLARDEKSCLPIRSNLDTSAMRLCRVSRAKP